MAEDTLSLAPSISRQDMVYEISYLKRLSIVHKSFLMFYCRDRSTSLHLAKKIRFEFNRLYLAEEVKDAIRIISKTSMSLDHHGIDIIISDVDHTTVRVLECLNKRANAPETRRLPCLPVILLMPETCDEDMKANIHSVGGYDVILPLPTTPRELFATVMDLLYRRTIVENAYNDLRKEQRNLKYPHLHIFEDEKLPLHHLTVDEEDDEEEDDEMNDGGQNEIPHQYPSYCDDEDDYDTTEFDNEINSGSQFLSGFDSERESVGGNSTAVGNVQLEEDELHPFMITELRNVYSKVRKKRTASEFSRSVGSPASIGGSFTVQANRILDSKERQQLDRYILKCISKENNLDLKDGSDSDEEGGGQKLTTVAEEPEEKVISRRTALRVNNNQEAKGNPSSLAAKYQSYYRSDSINIMDESNRPTWKSGGNETNEADKPGVGSDMLPFVDRPRPDMSKPTTVAGMNKKTAMACWKVLHTKNKFGPGYVEHKHDRPWTTGAAIQKDSTSRAQVDETGTLRLSAVKAVPKPNHRTIDEERNLPEPVTWETPTRYLASSKTKRRFINELRTTKNYLKTLENKKPTYQPETSQGSIQSGNSTNSAKIQRTNSGSSPATPQTTKPSTQSTPLVDIAPEKVSVIREWRGFAETDTHDESGQRTAAMKLSGLLRSSGGIQFGNIITSVKARSKARRLVKEITATAKPDPDTSKLIYIKLDNRRIGSGEREHLTLGINLQNSGQLYAAFKAFGKAILVCKQLHLPTICRGIVQFQRGKFFSALKDFTEAIKFIEQTQESIRQHLDDLVIARFNRSMTHFRIGDDERGIEDLECAVECDPSNVEVRKMMILAYRRANNYIPAIEHSVHLNAIETQIKHKHDIENERKRQEELEIKMALNSSPELLKALEHIENQSSGRGPDVRRITSRRDRPQTSQVRIPGMARQSGSKPPSPKAKGPISLVNSRLPFQASLSTQGDEFEPDKSQSNTSSIVINRTEIQEYQFPSLKDKKNEYIRKKQIEERSHESVFLDTFKHANGFKKHLFDSLFICLSPIQEALVTIPPQRSVAQIQLITKILKSFPILCNNNENELNDISACIEYRTVTSKSTIFYQDDPVDALILVFTGQLQLKLESGQHTQILATLNPYECYGEVSLLFRNKYSKYLENLHQICLDETKSFHILTNDEHEELEGDDPGQLDTEKNSMNKSISLDKYDRIESYPRSLQAGSFMSCKVAAPSELLLIHSSDFDRLLRDQFEREFQERIELLIGSGIFQGIFSRHEMVRLGRMSVLRHVHQGDTILTQGERPDFIYFIMKGVCKVIKRPDPTEYMVRRLNELKNMALNYDQKYVFHHRLRGTFKPSSATTKIGSTTSSPTQKSHIGDMNGIGYKTAAEEERENLAIEISKLEVQVAKEKQLEQRRQEEEEELKRLGRVVPNKSVNIANVYWPQFFGEAALLQPDSGTSLGTIIAETVCDILCIHRTHLQTFHIDENLLQRVRDRSVHYPPDEILVQMLESNVHWSEFKKQLIDELPKDKWPKKKKFPK